MNRKTKTKKGFTLVEILVVIVILSILAIGVIAIITNYMNHGKEKYDESLESEFLLSGQSYFASNKDKIPTRETESNVVYLSELMSLNFVNGEFVDSKGNVCSADSSVMITNNGDKGYKYTACLYCGENSVFNKKGECKVYTIPSKNPNDNPSIDENKSCSEIIYNDSEGYYFTDKSGQKISKTKIGEIITAYNDSDCGTINVEECGKINISNKEFVYSSGNYYNKLEDAWAAGSCCNKYGIKNYSTSYKCIYSKASSYSSVNKLITDLNSNTSDVSSGAPDSSYYYHCLDKSTITDISKVSTSSSNPKVTNGSSAGYKTYWDTHKKTTKLKDSSNTFVKFNKPIPAEYSFAMGKATSTKVNNPTPMAWADVKSWKERYYNYTKKGWVTKNSANAKGNYWVKYTNVGTYNGQKVDLKMTLVNFAGCIKNDGATKCGLWFGTEKPEIYSLGVHYIKVRYEFFKSGTSTPITVKGYTTYWDVDAQQGIHFNKGTTGIYAYTGNSLYIYNINGAPYVYARTPNDDQGENGHKYVVSETFYGSSMVKTFTFLRAKDTNMSSYYRSAGQIENSPIYAGINLNYSGTAVNSDTVFTKNKEVEYIVKISNPTKNPNRSDGKRKVTITINNSDNLQFAGITGKSSNITLTRVAGNSLQWTTYVSVLSNPYIKFKMKVRDNDVYCGKSSTVSVTSKVDGVTTYNSSTLINPILCSKKVECLDSES